MVIPPLETGSWTGLASEAKTERLLKAAMRVFSEHGLDAPMQEVADAAGAGVASVYRLFPSKHDLLAALVIRRLEELTEAVRTAQLSGGDRWSALTSMIRSIVEHQRSDYLMGEARASVADDPGVQKVLERYNTALEQLLADARAEGRLRSDATTLDLRLLFAATRAAKRVEGEHWPRMLELLIDALDARPTER
jgi:AcrR family transcriptional regulator